MQDEQNGHLTKRELVARIATETGIVQQDVQAVLQKSLDYIVDSLVQGRNVEFRDFGVFQVKSRKARQGYNPARPEEKVEIPERRVVRFKPGKKMKEVVRGGQP
ncbi:MAG: HU family DNA-binding protein [Verrucomicrobia bacterium]|nr:HU family DNA-binding protein [Verrucomicrobiota bacterium]MDA1085926.1 HU family DNA-binding protein [Verrucomicrobiota bacterium]